MFEQAVHYFAQSFPRVLLLYFCILHLLLLALIVGKAPQYFLHHLCLLQFLLYKSFEKISLLMPDLLGAYFLNCLIIVIICLFSIGYVRK